MKFGLLLIALLVGGCSNGEYSPIIEECASCIPLTKTVACDEALGKDWGQGYGTELQIPYTCSYINQKACAPIHIANEFWWCCVDNPDAGYPALNPGAVANNDGGLP